jgi:hypothetical protein
MRKATTKVDAEYQKFRKSVKRTSVEFRAKRKKRGN